LIEPGLGVTSTGCCCDWTVGSDCGSVASLFFDSEAERPVDSKVFSGGGGGEKDWKKYWKPTITATDNTIANKRFRSMFISPRWG
jgi:hypothetical protein